MRNRIIAALLTILFLGVMLGGLFLMSADMSMGMGMTDCPFMPHEEMLCNMNITDHLNAWKSSFLVVVPALMFLTFATGVLLFFASLPPNLLFGRRNEEPILLNCIQERTYTFSSRPFQELFSNGILHPKLF